MELSTILLLGSLLVSGSLGLFGFLTQRYVLGVFTGTAFLEILVSTLMGWELSFGALALGGLVLLAVFLVYIIVTGSRSIRNYLLVRLALTIPTLWFLVSLVFFVMRVLPGDPIQSNIKPGTPPEIIAQIREDNNLNAPLHEQYVNYLTGLVQGDLGKTLSIEGRGTPVSSIIERRIPATLELILPSVGIMLLFGVYSGAFAAHHHRRTEDYSLRLSSVLLYSIPIFWMGLMFQLIFARELSLFPVANRYGGRIPFEVKTNLLLLDSLVAGDLDSAWVVLKHMALPTLTLSLALIGVFVRLTRSNMIEVLQEDYVTAARARGVPENRVVYRHALRNSFIPIMTFIGLQVAVLMGGAILTETTFSWDGMGMLIREGIGQRDFFVVQGAVTVFAVIVGIISTLTDILYAFVDPRIRY